MLWSADVQNEVSYETNNRQKQQKIRSALNCKVYYLKIIKHFPVHFVTIKNCLNERKSGIVVSKMVPKLKLWN